MTLCSDCRERTISTPVGTVEITEQYWDEDGEDNFWTYTQLLNPMFEGDVRSGDVLRHFVKQYAIAYQLFEEGYTTCKQLDSENLIWVKYTEV